MIRGAYSGLGAPVSRSTRLMHVEDVAADDRGVAAAEQLHGRDRDADDDAVEVEHEAGVVGGGDRRAPPAQRGRGRQPLRRRDVD